MRRTAELNDWNFQALAVVQAAQGMVSSNFRRISLEYEGGQWLITFVLEREDAEDREEISDFEAEWDALQSRCEPREIRTFVTSAEMPDLLPMARILYQRREKP